MDQEKRDRGGQVKTQNGKAKQNEKKTILSCVRKARCQNYRKTKSTKQSNLVACPLWRKTVHATFKKCNL